MRAASQVRGEALRGDVQRSCKGLAGPVAEGVAQHSVPPSFSRNAEVYVCLLLGDVQMMEAIRASVPEAVLMLESILPKL